VVEHEAGGTGGALVYCKDHSVRQRIRSEGFWLRDDIAQFAPRAARRDHREPARVAQTCRPDPTRASARARLHPAATSDERRQQRQQDDHRQSQLQPHLRTAGPPSSQLAPRTGTYEDV
jgi:hypothetical protein